MPPIARLALRNITKRYAPVVANDDISFDVMPGEIVALLGENGAGKSTLMKIAYGIARPDRGSIFIDGAPVAFASPQQARSSGIAMVFQQFALFDSATVLENVVLGLPPEPMRTIEARLRELATRYGLQIDPVQRVHDLSTGERQRIEILRALMSRPRVLILDEPTSVLTPQAVERLFATLRQLAADDVSIVFISHKLHEIRELATRSVVVRAGKVVAEVDPRTQTEAQLAHLMLGADPPAIGVHESPPGDIALQVCALSYQGAEQRTLDDVSFEVRTGEVVGIAGISGNGQAALMAVLAGEQLVTPDAIRLFNQPVGHLNAAERRKLGLRYVPEQRLGHGAVRELSLADNAMLTDVTLQESALTNNAKASQAATDIIERFGVRASSPAENAETLSGGNLQKFIVGREVLSAPRVLLINQPTWGVDAGSAAAIRNDLINLRNAGCAIVVVSEELDELYQLADRLLVISNGRLSPSRARNQLGVAELGRWMAGQWPADRATHAIAERL